ncbi:MAG: hypothetical protein ACXWCY_09480 [Burkholderiales bacterium]
MTTVRDLRWSHAEKKIARAAFDSALAREKTAARKRVEAILQESDAPDQIWEVYEFLRAKSREFEEKYDYRYSVLIWVFRRLMHEGWLTESDLDGLAAEKVALIRDDLSR